MPKNIKNVIFDFGNVLFDLDLPRIEQGLRQLMGDQFDTARAKLAQQRIFELYETGGLSTEEFVDAIRCTVTPPLSAASVIEVWNSIFLHMPTHRFQFLLDLRKKGYKVFLLSNINALHADWIDDYMLRVHALDDFRLDHFDGVYYSHLIRLRKPDREIYEYMLADAELKPEESVFIDDLQVNIEAAEAVGIHGLWHPVGTEVTDRVWNWLGDV